MKPSAVNWLDAPSFCRMLLGIIAERQDSADSPPRQHGFDIMATPISTVISDQSSIRSMLNRGPRLSFSFGPIFAIVTSFER